MRLILTRHGETLENVSHLCQGQLIEGQLSERGKEQVEKLARRLKDEKIDIIYSSKLKRAADTTKAIKKYHPGVKVIYDERIKERYLGKMEGKIFPPDWDWDNMPDFVETDEAFCKRVKEFLDEVYQKHKNQTVLVVSHGGTKMALLIAIYNKPVSSFLEFDGIKNTALSIFEIMEDKKHIVHLLNSTEHLN